MTRRTPLLAGLTLAAGALLLAPTTAWAAPAPQLGATGASVSAVSDLGDAVAAADGATTLRLSGTGFQSVDGGFGGIYVLFGWVADGAWQPSAGGGFGSTYQYQPDTQAAENSGFQKFVTFPGSSTAGEANGSELALDGSWATELEIPGPVLTVTDAAGAERQLDCRVETCGVITFGAHGVVNANNETFTPVSFTGVPGAVAPGAEGAEGEGDGSEASDAGATEQAEVTPEPTPEPEESSAPASSEESDEATAAADGAADAADAAETSDDEGGSSAAPWIVAGSAGVAAIGAAVAAWTGVRRRRASTPVE